MKTLVQCTYSFIPWHFFIDFIFFIDFYVFQIQALFSADKMVVKEGTGYVDPDLSVSYFFNNKFCK